MKKSRRRAAVGVLRGQWGVNFDSCDLSPSTGHLNHAADNLLMPSRASPAWRDNCPGSKTTGCHHSGADRVTCVAPPGGVSSPSSVLCQQE